MRLINCTVIAFEGVQAQWRRALAINAHERLAIAHLYESGAMTMSELGERIPLSRAAVTSLADRLEKLGYMRRSPDENDRRRTILSITDVPQEIVAPLAGALTSDLAKFIESFDDVEWDGILRFLGGVRAISHTNAAALRASSDTDLLKRTEGWRERLEERERTGAV